MKPTSGQHLSWSIAPPVFITIATTSAAGLQAHRTGSGHLTKDQLISAADRSALADIPIQGNNNAWAARQRGPAKWYDGWSNIKVGPRVTPGNGTTCLLSACPHCCSCECSMLLNDQVHLQLNQ